MDINKRIYLKGIIEAEGLAYKWEREQISKKIMYAQKNNCLNLFARSSRGKHSYAKALIYYQLKRLNHFL